MKFTVSRDLLKAALSQMVPYISGRNTLPILETIRIEAQNDSINFLCTDLDTACLRSCKAAGIEEFGAACVNLKWLHAAVSLMDDPTVSVTADGSWFSVSGMDAKSKFFALPAEDFPVVTEVVPLRGVTVSAVELSRAFKEILFAASDEESRSILMGALFELNNDGQLRLVTTDTHRLSVTCLDAEAIQEDEGVFSSIIPARTLRNVALNLRSVKDEVTILLGKDQASFSWGDGSCVTTRVLDGVFPNYGKVVPAVQGQKIIVARTRLVRAVQQIRMVAKQNSGKGVLCCSDRKLSLQAASQDCGESESIVREVVFENIAEPWKFALNTKYLSEYLASVGDEKIEICVSSPLSPFLFRPYQDPDGEVKPSRYQHVVMPMQV